MDMTLSKKEIRITAISPSEPCFCSSRAEIVAPSSGFQVTEGRCEARTALRNVIQAETAPKSCQAGAMQLEGHRNSSKVVEIEGNSPKSGEKCRISSMFNRRPHFAARFEGASLCEGKPQGVQPLPRHQAPTVAPIHY